MLQSFISLDQQVFDFIFHLPHPNFLINLMILLTLSGVVNIIWLIIATYYSIRDKDKRLLLVSVLTTITIGLLVEFIIKSIFARPRPPVTPYFSASLLIPKGFSFPSGHAAGSSALATILSRTKKSRAAIYYTLATLISLSRIYLGVHYPLDVLAGMLVGLLIGKTINFLTIASDS